MKTVCILTATRAEYGLLKPVIKEFLARKDFCTKVAVTGMHLSSEFGLTYKEIESDGISIDTKIDIQVSSSSSQAISKTMALALLGFADYFERIKPDLLVVLGDRYETLAVCCAAMNQRIPIAHIAGGETTEGAVDEAIRHSITKMSYLHFTEAEPYTKRVIQLGENPERVFTAGYLGIENVQTCPKFSLNELSDNLQIKLDEKKYAVVTFHPVTLENQTAEEQIIELLKAIERYPDFKFIFTKSNADAGGELINEQIDKFVKTHPNCKAFFSLGLKRYLSALEYSAFVIGNSSSGLSEAPAFGIPTINIGDRQKGRLMPKSVICCEPREEEIVKVINTVISTDFINSIKTNCFDYKELPSKTIVRTICDFLIHNRIDIKKSFFDFKKI